MASLSGVFNLQELTDLGALGAGMRLYTYAPSTTTLKVAYTDAAGTIPHSYTSDGLGGQYLALNSRGELPAPLFLAAGGYDIALKTSAGVTVWTRQAFNMTDAFGDAAGAASIFFQQTGTGAAVRNMLDKMREAKSVADFGAVGDGATDDTTAIQNALNACLNLDFGDQTKNYRVTGTLVVRSNTQLLGNGARIFQETLQTPLFNCVDKDRVTFTGLSMTGAQMSTATAGTFVIGRRYSIMTVGTTNFVGLGAASNTAGVFFTATAAGTGTGTASTFYNTPNSQDIGIKADRATNLTVERCNFDRFAYSPLMVALWGSNIKFLHNVVTGPGAAILNPLSLPDPQVPGFRNCTGVTILGYGIEVHGNTFSGTSQGVYIGQQSQNFKVTSNTVLDTVVEHGMYCDAGCKHGHVTNNDFNNTKLIGAKVQWYDLTLAATALVVGGTYVIDSVGATDFTLCGAASNTVGLEFRATAVGTGTGVCSLPDPCNIVVSHNSVNNAGGDGLLAINAGPATIATITGVTQANPGVFTTAAAHTLAVGDLIDIGGVLGMTPVNSAFRVAAVPTATTFRVRTPAGELNTTAFPAYVSGGTVARPVYGRGIVFANNTLKNIGQDCISARYCDGINIEGNTIETGARVGIYQLLTLNANTAGNIVRDVQQNGIYCYSPIDQCSIYDNNLLNPGAAGVDLAGASSGIFVEGDGGGIVEGNIVQGELTRTKMLYGIQLGSGDKTQWSIDDNQVYDAEGAIVALHGLDNASLRSFSGNIGTAATGPDALTGLATALPNRGNPRPDWWSDAAPTTGFWPQGSKVWKILPNAGDPLGWVNVSSGSPGTFVPFGAVQSANAYTVTNPSTDRALNVTADTLPQVAAVLGTLIADLQASGVLK